ncbi:MAG: sulfatase [Candidatus Omnitrophota bacterium]|nr:MAG: sulfatase [Candidatus Omnitrophota bacterium]
MQRTFFSKRTIVLVSVLIIVALLFLFSLQKEKGIFKTSRPNILFIVLDAARADHFGCYGYERNTTPFIDAAARRGALFLNHFTNATHTSGALPKIFFSRYFSLPIFETDGWVWGIKQSSPELIFGNFDNQQIFLTELLSRYGYYTVIFHPHPMFNENSYLIKKFDECFYIEARGEQMPAEVMLTVTTVGTWIRQNKRYPFFIYCHIMSPHEPYHPRDEDREFLEGFDVSAIREARKKFRLPKKESAEGFNQRELEILEGFYDSNLKHVDKWVGKLLNDLQEFNLDDNTLVIITSDHGQNLGEHNHLAHGGLPWDSVIKVPLVMIYPPLIPDGAKVSALTESVDIAPTILNISKISLPWDKTMDGINLLKVIRNNKFAKDAVFTEDSIRTTHYKYFPDSLYDLQRDPKETRNIVEEEPSTVEKLEEKFQETLTI